MSMCPHYMQENSFQGLSWLVVIRGHGCIPGFWGTIHVTTFLKQPPNPPMRLFIACFAQAWGLVEMLAHPVVMGGW